MKTRIVFITVLVAVNFIRVNAQDLQEIEKRYGKRAEVYTVSQRLWMTPSFGDDGQVCMMRVYPRTVSHNKNYLDAYLEIDAALTFINELSPVKTRGPRINGFGLADLGGGVIWTRFEYEHVHFVFVSSFRLTRKPESQGEPVYLDVPIDAAAAEFRRKEEMKSDDQLIREHIHQARVLEISWPSKKCST